MSKRLSSQVSPTKLVQQDPFFFQEITQGVPVVIGVYNILSGEYIYINDTVEKIMGYTKAEFMKGGIVGINSLVHPGDIRQVMEKNQMALAQANSQKHSQRKEKIIAEFEYRMRHKNGTWIWVKTYGSVFKRTPTGEVELVLNVSFDISKRKDAEQRARESQRDKQISTMIKHMNDAFISHDEKGNYFFVNEKAAQMLGRKREEFEGQNVWKLYPELKKSSMYPAVSEVIKTRKPKAHEYFSPVINRWLIANIYPTDEGVSIYFTDISKRKKAEDELKRSEERYRAFIKHSGEGIWLFELEKPVDVSLPAEKQIDTFYRHAYLAECNNAFAKMYGYRSGKQLIGARLSEFLPQDDEANIEYLTAFIQAKYSLMNTQSHEKDRKGRDKYFENNLIGIVENGQLLRAWGTQRDVTAVVGAEREKELLRKQTESSEERLALALQSSQMGIWDWDITTNTITWSEQLEKLYGLRPGGFTGSYEQYQSLIHPDDRERMQQIIQHALDTGKQYQVEHRALWPDGSIHWILGLGRAYYDPKTKKPVRMTGASQNIDARKRIEERKDDFIGMASHELKTPVTSLKIFTQILRRQFEQEGKTTSIKYLEKMDDQINKLTRLIRELLDVSKISAGKLKITRSQFDLRDLTKEIIEYLQETTKQKIRFSSPPEVMVSADRDRLGQVIINLLTNAIKYSNGKGEIRIRIVKKHKEVVLSVKDDGVGIDKEDKERIFERFYQVTTSPDSAASGLGMGLYIAHQIIMLHKGHLLVESEKGKGSTFSFVLPLG